MKKVRFILKAREQSGATSESPILSGSTGFLPPFRCSEVNRTRFADQTPGRRRVLGKPIQPACWCQRWLPFMRSARPQPVGSGTPSLGWAKSGVFERIFKQLASDHDNEYMMIDATIVRAHQHSAGAQKKTTSKRSVDPAAD
jgi:hypothetical protein